MDGGTSLASSRKWQSSGMKRRTVPRIEHTDKHTHKQLRQAWSLMKKIAILVLLNTYNLLLVYKGRY